MTTVGQLVDLRRWQCSILSVFCLGGIYVAAWGPRLPTLKVQLGIDTATIGLLLGGVTVGAVVGFVVSTPVLRWLGSRRALTGALLIVAAGMTLLGAAVTLDSVPLVTVAFFAI